MPMDIIGELNIDQLREGFTKFTRKAFHMLPKMDMSCILDIGCGPGLPTLELATLSDGEIYGIDIDQKALNTLNSIIKRKGLSDRVKTLNCSLYNTPFPDEKFDLLWEEGVLHLLDLKKSLKECNRLLKPGGFLVLDETRKWMHSKFDTFAAYGFKLRDHFPLPDGYWWTDYYAPLEKQIKELYVKYPTSPDLEKLLLYESEIKMVKKNPEKFNCAFYIMKKS